MRYEQIKPWNAKRLTSEGKHVRFAFEGTTITSVRIGGGIKLYLGDDFATHIELWMPFALERFGQSSVYDPFGSTELAPFLELIGKSILRAMAKDGFLELEFENKVKIQAPSDQSNHRWEAWQISDRHGFHVVCAIGGRLAMSMPDAAGSERRNKPGNPYFD